MRQFRTWVVIASLIAAAAAGFSRIESVAAQGSALTLLSQADEARRTRHFYEAEKLYNQVLQSQPGPRARGRALNGLTHVQFSLGRIDESERTLEKARIYIGKNFPPDDLLMASVWQAHALIRLQKYRDRTGAQDAIEKVSAIRNARLNVWETTDNGAMLRYKPIGFAMPMQSGVLKYVNRAIHDDTGTDVSVNFDGMLESGSTVRVTVYAYRMPPATGVDALFRQELEGVQAFNRNARLLRNETFPLELPGGEKIGHRAMFQYAGQGLTVDTRLYLLVFGDWAIKLRVTGNKDDEAATDAQVAQLMRALVWPR